MRLFREETLFANSILIPIVEGGQEWWLLADADTEYDTRTKHVACMHLCVWARRQFILFSFLVVPLVCLMLLSRLFVWCDLIFFLFDAAPVEFFEGCSSNREQKIVPYSPWRRRQRRTARHGRAFVNYFYFSFWYSVQKTLRCRCMPLWFVCVCFFFCVVCAHVCVLCACACALPGVYHIIPETRIIRSCFYLKAYRLFFLFFPRCCQLNYSIANDPLPLTPEQRHVLGWEAATDRLVESAKVTVRESLRRRRELDEVRAVQQQ